MNLEKKTVNYEQIEIFFEKRLTMNSVHDVPWNGIVPPFAHCRHPDQVTVTH